MKHLFNPVNIALGVFSFWLLVCCSASLEWTENGNLLAHSFSIWGDWSAHFTFISNLLERGPGWIHGDNPVFSEMPFQYPFLSHLFTAIFAFIFRAGPISATYTLSLLLLMILPFALHRFYRALDLKPWTAFVAVILFLLAGGFQFFDSSLNPNDALTNQFNNGSIFTQFVVFELFPQRAFLFGVLWFCFLGTAILNALHAGTKTTTKNFVVLAFFMALSALLHLHTWIALASVAGFFFCFAPLNLSRTRIFKFGAVVLAFSGVFLWFLLFRSGGGEFRASWSLWLPGWAQNASTGMKVANEMNFFSFWLFNTGIFFPLAFAGAFIFRQNRLLYAFAIAGFFLFTICLFLNLQPYFYDNLKTFTYSYFLLAPLAALAIEKIFTAHKFLAPVAVGIVLLQSVTALHDLNFLREKKQTAEFFSAAEFELAENFKNLRSSANALVLINPRHNHWVPCLTGNPIVMGYQGWLWSWAINYGPREKLVYDILLGRLDAEVAIAKLQPHYIVVNTHEQIGKDPINHAFLKSRFSLVLEKNGWEVYSAGNLR